MNYIVNHANEIFKINIIPINLSGEFNNCKSIAEITITFCGETISTGSNLLVMEDLFLLKNWLLNLYNGKDVKQKFDFKSRGIYFKIWLKLNKPVLRFFIKTDDKTKYFWEWEYVEDNKELLPEYINKISEQFQK